MVKMKNLKKHPPSVMPIWHSLRLPRINMRCSGGPPRQLLRSSAVAIIAAVLGSGFDGNGASLRAQPRTWEGLPNVGMGGGLAVYWNIEDGTKGENERAAHEHGFLPLTILGTYADYPGNQKEHIGTFLGKKNPNPWNKPPYFERIIRRNIAGQPSSGTYVQDIEIDFEEDLAKVYADPANKAASGAKDLHAFEVAYYKEWASWYALPLKWTKEQYPGTKVGLYGAQPFRSDFWGISGKNAQQIDGSHQEDWRLWQSIEPFADFYVVSTYAYYADPATVFYMAANIEENYKRTRALSDKPVYAYQWLRYHDGNWREGNREVDPYIVEAMAVVPYFSGAKAIVLWGFEPKLKPGMGLPYGNLPLYLANLARVVPLSDMIGKGTLVFDEPASALWNAKRPLVRRVIVSPAECVAMAVNPWQADDAHSTVSVACGERTVEVALEGRHTALVHIDGERVERR